MYLKQKFLLWFRYVEEEDRWVAENKAYPNFSAYTNAVGTTLALGTQIWYISGDIKVDFKRI